MHIFRKLPYPPLRTFLTWLLSPLYLFLFVLILLVFHPIQVIAKFIGYKAQAIAFDLLNFCLRTNFRVIGTKMHAEIKAPLPTDRPLIIVSNHQSMYDIPFMAWPLRAHHPKFIAKIELAKGIPSISYALRNVGHVLIDRKNPRAAIPAIQGFGQYIEKNNFAACLFPEGTRGRDGAMKPFKISGFTALLKTIPRALVVPAAIEGSWEMLRYNLWPVPFGVSLKLTVFEPIEPAGKDPAELLASIEKQIRAHIGQEIPAPSEIQAAS